MDASCHIRYVELYAAFAGLQFLLLVWFLRTSKHVSTPLRLLVCLGIQVTLMYQAVQGALCALPPVATVVHGMFNPHPQSRMRFLHWVLCQLVTSGAPMLNVQIPAGLAR